MYNSQDNLFKRLLIVGAVILGLMGCAELNNNDSSESAKDSTIGITVNAISISSLETRETSKGGFAVTISPPVISTTETVSTVNISKTLEVGEIETMANSPSLYFMAVGQSENHIQVWQISADDWSFSKRYELTRTLNSPFPVQVPSGETATQIFKLVPTTTPVEEIFNEYDLLEISLATTGHVLGSTEWILHCIERSSVCFGLHRLYTFDFETGKENILINLPNHIAGRSGYAKQLAFGDLYLSPDGQYLAIIDTVVEGSSGSATHRPVVMNIEQEEAINLPDMTDVSNVLGWSSDSKTVVLKLGFNRPTDEAKGFRLCSVISKECQDIELDGLWIDGVIDWHPTEPQFAFSATTSDFALESCYDLELYIAKTEAGAKEIYQLPVDLSLLQPQWSSDGKYIAAWERKKMSKYSIDCYSPEDYLGTNIIAVLDAASGEIIQEIEGDKVQYQQDGQRPPQWHWGDNHTLLIHGAEGMKVVDIHSGVSQIVPYPPEMEWTKVWHRFEY